MPKKSGRHYSMAAYRQIDQINFSISKVDCFSNCSSKVERERRSGLITPYLHRSFEVSNFTCLNDILIPLSSGFYTNPELIRHHSGPL